MIVVYTAILSACDSLKPAPVGADRCVCFTDIPALLIDPKGWEIVEWKAESWKEPDPRREAWRLRCIPHELFSEATRTIWIDASFTLTDLPRLLRESRGYDLCALAHQKRTSCYEEAREIVRVGQGQATDVNDQMQAYRRVGFNPPGLSISCVIVRTNTRKVQVFNVAWDLEIRAHAGDNTQLSLDYCAWQSGLTVHHLTGVRKANPYAQHDHADHKKRRQPYREVVR